MKKTLLLVAGLAILISMPIIVSAQSSMQAGLNLSLGFPQGEFKENVEQLGYGLEGKFLYTIPQTPISIGASVSFLVYGRDVREVPFSLTIPNVYVDVITTNSIMYGHLMLRLQPPTGLFRPYVDLLGGFSLFSTDTEVKNQNDYDEENEIASSNDMRDFTSSYGFGAGFQFRVAGPKSYDEREETGFESIFVELGVQYLKGGEAEYLKQDGIKITNGKVDYDTKKSFTDIFIPHIGVIFTF